MTNSKKFSEMRAQISIAGAISGKEREIKFLKILEQVQFNQDIFGGINNLFLKNTQLENLGNNINYKNIGLSQEQIHTFSTCERAFGLDDTLLFINQLNNPKSVVSEMLRKIETIMNSNS